MSQPSDDRSENSPEFVEPSDIAAAWLDVGEDEITMSFADFIGRLGESVERFDEHFARRIASTLQARAAHVRVPAIEGFGLRDVVATLYMDKKMRLVVTGNHDATLAEVTLRWADRDFDSVGLVLSRIPHEEPYTFATIDFSVRDRKAVMRSAVGPLVAGQTVTVRCLATIGSDMHLRVSADGPEVAVQPDQLEMVAAT